MFTAAAFAATAATALGQSPTPTPTPTASPVPGAMDPVAADFQLSLVVWLSTLALAGLLSWAYFASKASDSSGSGNGRNGGTKTSPTPAPVTDRDLESARISYGFWLIIAGFLITLAVVIITINHFRTGNIADVVAVVTSVTGVIGTLTAAFFGIQAAGAGRSQALSALSEMKNGMTAATTDYKLDPIAGPHAGNTRISITGNGFTGGTEVNFGPTPGVNAQFTNDGLIYVTTPPSQLDRTAATQEGKSNVDVIVVFPGAAQNKVVGKFYYYTVDVETDSQRQPYIKIYGSGLAGASQVQFGTYGTLQVTNAATDAVLQIPINMQPPAKDVDPNQLADSNNSDFWNKVWNQEVEVTIVYGADATATKRLMIGKYRIPQYPPPTQTTPDAGAASTPGASSTQSSSSGSVPGSSDQSSSSSGA